jgi:hypothetical protein
VAILSDTLSLPVRNALQGRQWIFAAQSEMEYVLKTN